MDVSTQQSFHQLSKEEGQWITYWQHHPHLPRWHAQTAIRHVRDQQLLHYVHDVWSGTPFDQQNHNNDDDHYQVPEIWATAAAADGAAAASPRTSGAKGAVDEDELVLRCLMHRNSDLLNNESASSTFEDVAAMTMTGSSSTNEPCNRNDISGGQGEARASSSGPTTPPQSSHTSPAVLFSALSQYFSYVDSSTGHMLTGRASCTMKHYSSLSADNVANVPHVRSASSSMLVVRFQSQAANGLVGVWFRRLRRPPPQPAAAGGYPSNKVDAVAPGMTTNTSASANNASSDVDKCIDEQITGALTTAGLSAWWSIAPSNVLRRLSDAYRSISATTEASTAASVAVSSRKDCMTDADVLLSAGRWLTPARLFPDALALQGSMVQLMRRAPFIHPHGAVQEIFEVFGPCSVREWRHHTQRSGGGGGKSRSAPCFLITFTGERPQLSMDNTADIENDGSDDAIRKLRRQQAAALRCRRVFAAEDASFALAQLQRFFAVDWGLTLTYQFGAGARRQIDAENDLMDVDEIEHAADPPAAPERTSGEATVSCDGELQKKERTPALDAAVDVVNVELDGVTSLKPKRKVYVAPSASAITSQEPQQQHQPQQPIIGHQHQHIPQLMCPLDGSCTQINDPDHQQVYLHRCTLPAPCAFQANPLHGPYFLH
ncbi:Hypothetical protein, putative [Bodo saltans]|uniref:Uncharacterized protein n=2 Tax=Bodo saltans TaxID=75058 RepID=A0A0S4J5I0_BODSA|nr:Hypothetical protein, putative [Bodo saltans]|eukprot:CUG83571.1 Hypothetical protein, putative [Bodo saltans]